MKMQNVRPQLRLENWHLWELELGIQFSTSSQVFVVNTTI